MYAAGIHQVVPGIRGLEVQQYYSVDVNMGAVMY